MLGRRCGIDAQAYAMTAISSASKKKDS